MKKYIIPAIAALLALAACSKQESVQDTAREIGFQVANYVQTKADASPVKFTNKDFGTYAWHHAEDGAVTAFIKNEQVGQNGFDFKPTYGTGDSRESTVMTIVANYHGKLERRCFRLFNDYNLWREPECSRDNDPDRYDACVYERCCVLLCREIPGVKA